MKLLNFSNNNNASNTDRERTYIHSHIKIHKHTEKKN